MCENGSRSNLARLARELCILEPKGLYLNRFQVKGVGKMAGDKVFFAYTSILRHLVLADVFCIVAPRMKGTTGRRIYRTGNIPFERDSLCLVIGIRNRNRRHQRFGVGMPRI